jgi:hypothetical protein
MLLKYVKWTLYPVNRKLQYYSKFDGLLPLYGQVHHIAGGVRECIVF